VSCRLTITLSLLQNHPEIQFSDPFGLREGRIEIEPVSVTSIVVHIGISVPEAAESEPMLFEIEDKS
jgi:hypothetical protein